MVACEHRFVPWPGSASRAFCERCGTGKEIEFGSARPVLPGAYQPAAVPRDLPEREEPLDEANEFEAEIVRLQREGRTLEEAVNEIAARELADRVADSRRVPVEDSEDDTIAAPF